MIMFLKSLLLVCWSSFYSLALKAFKRLYLDLRGWEEFKSHGNLWLLCEGSIFCTIVSNNSNIKHPPKQTKKTPQKNQQIIKKINPNSLKKNSRKNPNLQAFPYHLSWIKLDKLMHIVFCRFTCNRFLALPVTTSVYRIFFSEC